MHRIVGGITRCHQFAYPAARIIIESDEVARAREAGMVEQSEMIETELASNFAKKDTELRQLLAGFRRLSEAVA